MHVILRTCQNSLLKNAIHDTRICGNDRELMIYKCLQSLVESIQHYGQGARLTILDDHSDEPVLDNIKAIAGQVDATVISLEERGFNYSAFMQFDMAAKTDGLVYTVEDDYLHTKDCLREMENAYGHFKGMLPLNEVAIHPYDCQDRYKYVVPCKIFYGGNRYWRTIKSSTNTIMASGSVFKAYFPVFKKLALGYGFGVEESDTINHLYNNLVEHGGPVTLFSPIPSLAVHLSYEAPTEIKTEMFNWKTRWDEVQPAIEINERG